MNNAGPVTGPGRWLIDSGAAVDLLGRSDVPEIYECLVTEADPPARLITANGKIVANETIPLASTWQPRAGHTGGRIRMSTSREQLSVLG